MFACTSWHGVENIHGEFRIIFSVSGVPLVVQNAYEPKGWQKHKSGRGGFINDPRRHEVRIFVINVPNINKTFSLNYLCDTMFTRESYIQYWTKTANHSWEAGEYLMRGGKNAEALFMFCLAIEKWIKANWILDNVSTLAPRIHDLQSLLSQTELALEPQLVDFLDTVNRWNLEGRYPDYKFSLHRLATEDYTKQQFEKLQLLKTCLLERL